MFAKQSYAGETRGIEVAPPTKTPTEVGDQCQQLDRAISRLTELIEQAEHRVAAVCAPYPSSCEDKFQRSAASELGAFLEANIERVRLLNARLTNLIDSVVL